MTRVAVIGAGAAGLVSAHEILRAGFEVCVFEASPQVGGIWCYTPETDDDLSGRNPGESVWSSVYSSLRTNLPRDVMAFMDYTFDSAGGGKDDWPRFPHHSLVLEYLQQFARDFDITSHIRFETEVTRVAPQDGRWTVETHSKAGASEETFDAVMVCNGHYAKPRVPSLPGIDQFEGRIWHSHNYRTPQTFEGRRVALWGTSASGADISLELSQVADVTWCGNAFSGAEPGKVIRGMKVYPSPTCITREGRLEFADGSFSEPVDDFMFCTGYEYSFPFLDDDVIHVDDNRVHPLYQQLIPPSLAFRS